MLLRTCTMGGKIPRASSAARKNIPLKEISALIFKSRLSSALRRGFTSPRLQEAATKEKKRQILRHLTGTAYLLQYLCFTSSSSAPHSFNVAGPGRTSTTRRRQGLGGGAGRTSQSNAGSHPSPQTTNSSQKLQNRDSKPHGARLPNRT